MELPKLRAIRRQQLLTQQELAELAGLTTASVSRIETGTTKARISTVRKLAAALEVDPSALLIGTDHEQVTEKRTDQND